MSKINWSRVVVGGIVAAILVNVLQAPLDLLMRADWQEAMKGMKQPGPSVLVAHLLWSFVIGIATIWLYAAIRPRYGPGWVTALRAGFAVWLFVHATFAFAAGSMELLPTKLMLLSALFSLPATFAATLVGARIYRE
jgi:hypothetical protein